jgi:hypothetical protein
VNLRVYVGAGRTRDVQIKTVAASTLSGRRQPFLGFPTPMVAPTPPIRWEDSEFGRNYEVELRRLQEELGRAGRTLMRTAPTIRTIVTNRIVL